MLVLEPAAALPLKAERVFTAGLLPVWELSAGENTVYPFNPVQGPHRMRLKMLCSQACMLLPGRTGEGAAEEREPCKGSGGQGSGLLLFLAEHCAA